MKIVFKLIFLSILLCSCVVKKNKKRIEVVSEDIENILSSNDLGGVILLFDNQRNTLYSNDFTEAAKPELPASTFKIPNTIIGLETGVLENENSVFKWKGEKRDFSLWERDLTVKDAFKYSCVPCYQELARKIGAERMRSYLAKMKYGKMVFNHESLDCFWLKGNSKITPLQQIGFLRRLYFGELPILKRTTQELKKILRIKQIESALLSGKTGSLVGEKKIGWFVGYVEKGDKVFFFATKIYPKNNMSSKEFLSLRQKVTLLALKKLKL